MAAQLARHAGRGDSVRRSSDACVGGAVQRTGRVNMTSFKTLVVVMFMIMLCTERWGDPHILECEGRTLVVSRADGSSEGGESSTKRTHTLEDVDEGTVS
jgi:hypothetical protein